MKYHINLVVHDDNRETMAHSTITTDQESLVQFAVIQNGVSKYQLNLSFSSDAEYKLERYYPYTRKTFTLAEGQLVDQI